MLLGIGFHQNDNFQSVKWDLIMVTIMGLKRALSKIDFKGAFAMDQTSPNFKECQTKHLEIDVSLAERRRKIPFSKALHGAHCRIIFKARP